MVSHDLKTPLTSIKAIAQLLHRQLARTDLPDRDEMVAKIGSLDAHATKMAAHISELLDVASVSIGRRPVLHRKPVDLVGVCRDHEQLAPHHRLVVETSVESLIGDWDAEHLERMVDNLVSNAVKYSPNGGAVRVSISLVSEKQDANQPAALLRVQDQGIGIPATDLPRVFEAYHRAANVGEGIRGTGLGLASVHSIVEQHGGTILVESHVGRGSTFTVQLPLSCSIADG